MTFAPRLESLPEEQRALWPALAGVPRSFVFYGGTAISLEDGLGAAVALYGAQFPPMVAVKALAWFETDDARDVDAETRELLSRTAANWRCTVSEINKSEERGLGP